MKNKKISPFLLIEICGFIMIIIDFILFLQVFATTIDQSAFGSMPISVTGYDIIFGFYTKNSTVTPSYQTFVHFNPSIIMIIVFSLLIISSIIQIFICILKFKKIENKNILFIVNLVSSIIFIISGILTFFSVIFFIAANPNEQAENYVSLGSNTTAIFLFMTGLILGLNSFLLIKKKTN